jgi:hypothetical protein
MRTDNVAGEYQAKTDEELSRLGLDLGPPLPSEESKPPWRPKVAGRIAFFFGPIAGALVVASSLRRMGYQDRAKEVMYLALGMTVLEAALFFFIPGALPGFVAEIAFLLFFPAFMEGAFLKWQAAHPDAKPSRGWSAIGWGLVGIVVFLAIVIPVLLGLSALLPGLA